MGEDRSAIRACPICGFEVPGGECLNADTCTNLSSGSEPVEPLLMGAYELDVSRKPVTSGADFH